MLYASGSQRIIKLKTRIRKEKGKKIKNNSFKSFANF